MSISAQNNYSTNIAISVIVPAYNAEKYIVRCISSLLKQTFDLEYEIIVVDDGSTDNTPTLLDQLSNDNPRLIVIHKVNGGVSTARNTGLDNARGEWVAFVDADDWVSETMLSGLYQSILNGFDLAMAKMVHYDENKDSISRHVLEEPLLECAQTPNCPDAQKKCVMGYALRKGVAYSNLSKLYRKSIIEDFSIRFNTSVNYCEDVLFNCTFMKHAKIIICDNDYYYYTISSGNTRLTNTYSDQIVDYTIISHNELAALFRVKQISETCYFEELDLQLLQSLWDIIFRLLSGKYKNLSYRAACRNAVSILTRPQFTNLMAVYKEKPFVCGSSITGKMAKKWYHCGKERALVCKLVCVIKVRDIIKKLIKRDV